MRLKDFVWYQRLTYREYGCVAILRESCWIYSFFSCSWVRSLSFIYRISSKSFSFDPNAIIVFKGKDSFFYVISSLLLKSDKIFVFK